MDFSEVDAKALANLMFAVVGFVTAFRAAYKKQWEIVGVIAVAGIVGAVFSSAVGIHWFIGMLAGFSGSGVLTAVSYVAKSTI